MRNNKIILLLIMAMWMLVSFPSLTAAADLSDTEIKQRYFTLLQNFVSWPHYGNSKVVACSYGNDAVTAAISRANLFANYIENVTNSNLKKCQMLYIAMSEADRVSRILKLADKYPILTVSSVSSFVKNGGAVEFYRDTSGDGFVIKLKINLDLAKAKQLKIDPELLEIITVYDGEDYN